jgi:hypothetical protein
MEKTTGPSAMARLGNPVIKINAYALILILITSAHSTRSATLRTARMSDRVA